MQTKVYTALVKRLNTCAMATIEDLSYQCFVFAFVLS